MYEKYYESNPLSTLRRSNKKFTFKFSSRLIAIKIISPFSGAFREPVNDGIPDDTCDATAAWRLAMHLTFANAAMHRCKASVRGRTLTQWHNNYCWAGEHLAQWHGGTDAAGEGGGDHS